MSHLAWYVNSARWAFEVIAEMCGFALEPVDVPGPQPSRHAPSYGHLVQVSRARSVESPGDYEAVLLYRHARHLRRVDEIGEQLLEADLDDVSALLGRRVSALGSDAELVEFIDRADEGHDERLIKVLDRRVQRLHLLLGPTGSLLLRHPRLRHLRPDVEDDIDDAQRWPAGAIPGTG